MALDEPPVAVLTDVDQARHLPGVLARLHPHHQDDQICRDLDALAREPLVDLDQHVAVVARRGPTNDRVIALSVHQEQRLGLGAALVEILAALAERVHVDVEVGDAAVGDRALDLLGVLERGHAAHARAVSVELAAAGADAVDDGGVAGLPAVLGLDPARPQPLLELERGDHVGQTAPAVVRNPAGIELLVAGRDDDVADRVHRLRRCGPVGSLHGGREVADESRERLQLAPQQDLDALVPPHPRDSLGQEVTRRVQVGGGEVHAGQVPPEVVRAFDEHDRVAPLGEFQRRGQARDAAAEHQRCRAHLGGQRFEGLVAGHAEDRRPGKRHGLLRGGLAVPVHPTALLADVGHLAEIGIEPCRAAGVAERPLVHARAAGGYDNAIEPVLPNVGADHLLTRVRAHVAIGAGHGNARQRPRVVPDGVGVDDVADVGPATADEHADRRVCHDGLPCQAARATPCGSAARLARRASSASVCRAAKYMASGR